MNGLLDSVLSGVGQAGEAVDKFTGGRALRGLAAGKPRELLSALPFSDTMGVTDEHDKTSGRDVTDTWGLTSKGDTSFGSHALGFGADMVLNPLSLVGAGAAAKAAPTLGKGLVAGAKALSGADLLEHIGGGMKGLGSHAGQFAADESGALKPDSLLKWLPFGNDTKVNPAVQNAAAWIGPQYKGGADQLRDILGGLKSPAVSNPMFSDLRGSLLNNFGGLDKLAAEIPEGSQFLGHGMEALALKTPQGGVVRMAPEVSSLGSAGRADIPEIVQPHRNIVIPGGRGEMPWQVEHLPMVNPILPTRSTRRTVQDILAEMQKGGHPDYDSVRGIYGILGDLDSSAEEVGHGLRNSILDNPRYDGLNPWDFHGGNIAMTNEGAAIGHDGGMVRGSRPIVRHTPTQPHMIEDLQQAMKLGAPDAMREMLAKGAATGTRGQGAASLPDLNLAGISGAQAQVQNFLKQYGHIKTGSLTHNISSSPQPQINVESLLNNLAADLGGGGQFHASMFQSSKVAPSLLAMLGVPAAAGYAYQGN